MDKAGWESNKNDTFPMPAGGGSGMDLQKKKSRKRYVLKRFFLHKNADEQKKSLQPKKGVLGGGVDLLSGGKG